MSFKCGRHFLQIPGPTNVPERVLGAISQPTIDHRGPEFPNLTREILDGMKQIARTSGEVVIYPSSGTGAWEASLVNTLSPGDRVLMFETGYFAAMWRNVAERLGLEVIFMPGDWRSGIDPVVVEEELVKDKERGIKAVAVVHNETSTAVTSSIKDVRDAVDRAGHPALLFVDTISSLGSIDYRHDEWGVDVTVVSSQKGLLMPPGLSFNIISEKAISASHVAKLPKSFWDWQAVLEANKTGYFPYTPATNLLFGLREAISMLMEEGLEEVFKRHSRHAEAARRAVRGWGLEIVCKNPVEYSNTVTAVLMPDGQDADRLRRLVLEKFNMSLGNGLGKLKGKAFRIGHLGYFNDLMLAGTLSGVEMGLELSGIPHSKGGITSAMDYLVSSLGDQD